MATAFSHMASDVNRVEHHVQYVVAKFYLPPEVHRQVNFQKFFSVFQLVHLQTQDWCQLYRQKAVLWRCTVESGFIMNFNVSTR